MVSKLVKYLLLSTGQEAVAGISLCVPGVGFTICVSVCFLAATRCEEPPF